MIQFNCLLTSYCVCPCPELIGWAGVLVGFGWNQDITDWTILCLMSRLSFFSSLLYLSFTTFANQSSTSTFLHLNFMSASEFTASFEPLEVCGSGSFGLIRKVRRISDGQVQDDGKKYPNIHFFRLMCSVLCSIDFGLQGNRLPKNEWEGETTAGSRSQYLARAQPS